jgi:hypothetical protein
VYIVDTALTAGALNRGSYIFTAKIDTFEHLHEENLIIYIQSLCELNIRDKATIDNDRILISKGHISYDNDRVARHDIIRSQCLSRNPSRHLLQHLNSLRDRRHSQIDTK